MKFARIQLLCILFLIIFSNTCFAYLDPGTGSYIIQVIIAVILGAAFSIKMFWNKIVSYFRKIFKK